MYNFHFGKKGKLEKTRKFANYLFLIVMGAVCLYGAYDSLKTITAKEPLKPKEL